MHAERLGLQHEAPEARAVSVRVARPVAAVQEVQEHEEAQAPAGVAPLPVLEAQREQAAAAVPAAWAVQVHETQPTLSAFIGVPF